MTRCLVLIAGSAAVWVAPTPAAAQTASVATPARAPSPAVERNGGVDHPLVVGDAELGGYRGGETRIVTTQTLNGVTTGNVLNGDYVAGAVSISDKALSSFNGIGNFAINTGAQVSLQSGMNLTINVSQ